MTRRRISRVFAGTSLLLVLAAIQLAGQGGGRGRVVTPDRDTGSQTAIGTATISGTVVLEGSGSPVRRARVSIAAPELRGGRSAITDEQGRFSFPALPAGRYTITASKAGHVDITYGAKRAGRPGTPVQLGEGQSLERLSLAMPRGGVITGIVVDEHGEPAAGTQVRALRYVMQTGERRLQMAGQDQTDDRGMYRIFQLQPGDYMINAVPRNMAVGDIRQAISSEIASLTQLIQTTGGQGFAESGPGTELRARLALLQQQMAASDQMQSTAYAPVYYPGTAAPASAQTIPLGAGEERAGVDFQLQLVPTTSVGGIVVGPAGGLPAGTTVALIPAHAGAPDIPGLGNNMTRVGAEGRFNFDNVTPGDYMLQARAVVRSPVDGAAPARGRGRGPQGPIAQVLWASADVGVGGQPLPQIVLNLQSGMTVSGVVRFEGSGPAPTDLSEVRVTLAPRGPQEFEIGGVPPTQADESGRFRITGVAPGRYTLSAALGGGRGGRGGLVATGPSSQWMLRSAIYNGQDLLDFPVEIAPNQHLQDIVLTWSTQTQELTGTIQDTAGGPTSDFTIIVFPSDPRYWQPLARRITATRPGTDGRFTFRGLPAGDYRLTAVTDVEPGEWYDPEFLNRLAGVSLPIALAEGERKVQDIRLAGG